MTGKPGGTTSTSIPRGFREGSVMPRACQYLFNNQENNVDGMRYPGCARCNNTAALNRALCGRCQAVVDQESEELEDFESLLMDAQSAVTLDALHDVVLRLVEYRRPT